MLKWKDDYLTWDEMPNAKYYATYTVQFPAMEIWFPPVQLINSLAFDKKIKRDDTSLVDIHQNGTIETTLYVQLKSDCELEFEMYDKIGSRKSVDKKAISIDIFKRLVFESLT